jgi:hypothetical protein
MRFIYRFIIGSLFIAEYFVGVDGHGRAAGNVMTLLFGIAFVGYGLYGFTQTVSSTK